MHDVLYVMFFTVYALSSVSGHNIVSYPHTYRTFFDLKREMRDNVSHSSMKARWSSTQQSRSFGVSMVNFTLETASVALHILSGLVVHALSDPSQGLVTFIWSRRGILVNVHQYPEASIVSTQARISSKHLFLLSQRHSHFQLISQRYLVECTPIPASFVVYRRPLSFHHDVS